MRIIFLLFILFTITTQIHGQKRCLDFSSPDNWPILEFRNISNDGGYIVYNQGVSAIGDTLIVQRIDNGWKRKIVGAVNFGVFTEDSRRLVFFTAGKDSLGILNLGKDSLYYIPQITSEFKVPEKGNGQWLAYQVKDPANTLVLLDLNSGKRTSFLDVENYAFSNDGHLLVMTKLVMQDSIVRHDMVSLDLNLSSTTVLCHSCEANNFVFPDFASDRLAFLSKEIVNGKLVNGLRYYKTGMDSASIILDLRSLERGSLSVVNIQGFNKYGDKIFFGIGKLSVEMPSTEKTLNIWSYRDDEIKRLQIESAKTAVVHLQDSNRLVYLEVDGECNFNPESKGDIGLVEHMLPMQSDRLNRYDVYLVSTKNGSKRLLEEHLRTDDLDFSLGGKYITWYDKDREQWYAFNIVKATKKCITCGIKANFNYISTSHIKSQPIGIAGWLSNDESVLIYDRYDIWKIDPDGVNPPINVTNNYGIDNITQLRFLNFYQRDRVAIPKKGALQILGFSYKRKSNEFFTLNLTNRSSSLNKHAVEPGLVYFVSAPDFPSADPRFYPIKAKQAGVYILKKMTATEYPNFYSTRDFIHFRRMTNLAPQKEYNWYTNETIHWRLFDSSYAEGILYKPQDFDSTKKYPLIFYYYEKSSTALNVFIHPGLSNGCLNIPWFVSNGYLVFVPDISYQDGHPGESAYNAVVSAANYLSQLSYVDNKHMGLQGHSFGGFETNYIVTRTNLFAAAAPAAGVSDCVSGYAELGGQNYYEIGQGRIGVTLWERPDLFIENSAIFKADKVNTPILIMHNRRDPSVDFKQEEMWFSGLARLGKKVWMLAYDGEGHTIVGKQNQLDYSTRLAQFFDYYLKGTPPPKWMTNGVSLEQRRGDDGLRLDYSGIKP